MKFSILLLFSSVFPYLTFAKSDDLRVRAPLIIFPTLPTTGTRLLCSEIYRCSLVPDPVWATDGKRCYVFTNPCQLGLENCNREQAGLHPLEPIDKEKCECRLDCPECDKPVCGSLNCTLLDFPSLCWMDYYNCKSGQVYTLHNWGPCEGR